MQHDEEGRGDAKAHKQLPVLKAGLQKHLEVGSTGVDQTAEAA